MLKLHLTTCPKGAHARQARKLIIESEFPPSLSSPSSLPWFIFGSFGTRVKPTANAAFGLGKSGLESAFSVLQQSSGYERSVQIPVLFSLSVFNGERRSCPSINPRDRYSFKMELSLFPQVTIGYRTHTLFSPSVEIKLKHLQCDKTG